MLGCADNHAVCLLLPAATEGLVFVPPPRKALSIAIPRSSTDDSLLDPVSSDANGAYNELTSPPQSSTAALHPLSPCCCPSCRRQATSTRGLVVFAESICESGSFAAETCDTISRSSFTNSCSASPSMIATDATLSPIVQRVHVCRGCTRCIVPCSRPKHGPHANCIPSQCALHYSHDCCGVCDGCGFSRASGACASAAAVPLSPVHVRSFLDEADSVYGKSRHAKVPVDDQEKPLQWAPRARQGGVVVLAVVATLYSNC